MSDISKKLNSIEKLAKEAERLAKNLQENPFSEFDRIIKDIQEQKENATAMEFTKCIRELLKKNGVVPKITEYTRENVRENSIEHRYGVSIDGLDFTEHDKGFKDEIERLKRQIEKLASIRTRCHESARDSFDSGNYGCLHIVTTDELKNSNEKVLKLESELFDVQKSADEYYNRCIDLTNQIAKLESELEVKDNLMKIKNGLCKNEFPTEITIDGYKCEIIQTEQGLYISRDRIYEIIDKEKKVLKDKCTELEDRHKKDCDKINQLKHELSKKVDFETDRLVKLPFDAMETANMLINATYKRENCMNGVEYDKDIYSIDDLEQIAEHLLVYCKHNKVSEE